MTSSGLSLESSRPRKGRETAGREAKGTAKLGMKPSGAQCGECGVVLTLMAPLASASPIRKPLSFWTRQRGKPLHSHYYLIDGSRFSSLYSDNQSHQLNRNPRGDNSQAYLWVCLGGNLQGRLTEETQKRSK